MQDIYYTEYPKKVGKVIIHNFTGWLCDKSLLSNIEVFQLISLIDDNKNGKLPYEKLYTSILSIVNNIRLRIDMPTISIEDAKKLNGNIKTY